MPGAIFCGFSDHSPIDERDTAAKGGLGVIGRNRLLINEEYSSFCFIGEIISDIPASDWPRLITGLHSVTAQEVKKDARDAARAGAGVSRWRRADSGCVRVSF